MAAQQCHQGDGQNRVGGDVQVEIDRGMEENGQQTERGAEHKSQFVALFPPKSLGVPRTNRQVLNTPADNNTHAAATRTAPTIPQSTSVFRMSLCADPAATGSPRADIRGTGN